MSEAKPVYKRVLLKVSGEALAGDKRTGLDFAVMKSVCEAVKKVTELGVEVGIVVGAGNFWRGAKDGGGKMERTRADHMGMLGTVMNALALSDVFEQLGVPVRVQTAIHMAQIAEPYIRLKADSHLSKGKVVIFGAGTGNPYFSTDTAAVLRAAEIGADAILLAKNIDGVYSADPKTDPTAVKYDHISYDDVLAQHLAVMDT
ncbi:MAG: UMP kinase, partial [Oscillospiraceae bacterium]|nr:UMP kinase [Oscillospiraceae bacterium]